MESDILFVLVYKCIIHIVGELSFIGFDTPVLTTIESEAKTGLRIK